eukprot:g2798.t1
MSTYRPTTILSVVFSVVLSTILIVLFMYTTRRKIVTSEDTNLNSDKKKRSVNTGKSLRILYATTTGTSKLFAQRLLRRIQSSTPTLRENAELDAVNLEDYDQDNLEHENVVVFLVSTWTGGKAPKKAEIFCNWLEDMAKDFRVGNNFLPKLRYAIFGLGNSEYDDNFCTAAKTINGHLEKLGATRVYELGEGDDMVDQQKMFDTWCDGLLRDGVLLPSKAGQKRTKGDRVVVRGKADKEWLSKREMRRRKREKKKKQEDATKEIDESDVKEDLLNERLLAEADEDCDDDDDESDDDNASSPGRRGSGGVMDVEDLSTVMATAATGDSKDESSSKKRSNMVTPKQRKALTKEGYKIIGTHSAVKLCRWTKHQLRGRGGCYKHTCYGITSYQCMEATPSLACANKCVFCWRHHKNPVGREWRWREDDPSTIVNQAISKHRQMIKEFRGVKGVKPERAREAMTVRHCALSLVGEPIMYPRINEMMRLLHEQRISTFLVTNAQFPDRIKQLDPVTQLYVSIDAATPESLKAVDRPLFKDFWQRFVDSLRALKAKRQRTVYRLTLVKGWNMEQIRDYAKLVAIGEPDFIEIKAVTYSGKSDGSSLTMKNVPFHEEVCKFSEALVEILGDDRYGIAAAHQHSCLVLVAKTRFRIKGRWHTWINYETFDRLIKRYYKSGKTETFTATDYMAPTPTWAVYGAEEQGFDPNETRFRKMRNGKIKERPYKSSESGCG